MDKRIKNKNYPHPVLGNGNDYPDGSFIVTTEAFSSSNKVTLKLKYEIMSDIIKKLVEEGCAAVVVRVESSVSGYRKIFQFSNNELQIDIENNLITDRLVVKPFILTKKENKNFKSNELFEIFNGKTFDIEKCGILAVADEKIYDLENFDPLKDKPSVFKIRIASEDQEDDIAVFMDELVFISLKKEVYDKYENYRRSPDVAVLLGVLFVVPVLTEILTKMQYDKYEDYDKGRKWYVALQSQLERLNIILENEQSMVSVANKVIAHAFNSSLDRIKLIYADTLESNSEVE